MCLSYWHTTRDEKYGAYADALAVICQCSIDGTKRSFDVDIPGEIKRIKENIDIKQNGYPAFWRDIRRDCNKSLINYNLQCPMNAVHSLTVGKAEYKNDTIPISNYFINHENKMPQKKSKTIECLIEEYSLKIGNYQKDKRNNKEKDDTDYLLLRSDYEDLLKSIRNIALPDKYIGLMSWLINRCFIMTPGTIRNRDRIQSKLGKNRPLLLKVLYDLNPKIFKKCFRNG